MDDKGQIIIAARCLSFAVCLLGRAIKNGGPLVKRDEDLATQAAMIIGGFIDEQLPDSTSRQAYRSTTKRKGF